MSRFDSTTIKDPVTGLEANVKANPNSTENELLVNLNGHLCPDNTTSTPLGIDGVFDGDWQDTLAYGVISISVSADEDSATDGLIVQWSSDGATVANTDSFTILGGVPKTFTFGPANRYVKLSYTNGGVAQTTFNLDTLLRRVYVKPSSHRIYDPIVGQDDAELVLDQNNKYLIRVTNDTVSNNWFDYLADWYEHTDKN